MGRARRNNPHFQQISGYLNKSIVAKFKGWIDRKKITQAQALEEAIAYYIASDEERLDLNVESVRSIKNEVFEFVKKLCRGDRPDFSETILVAGYLNVNPERLEEIIERSLERKTEKEEKCEECNC